MKVALQILKRASFNPGQHAEKDIFFGRWLLKVSEKPANPNSFKKTAKANSAEVIASLSQMFLGFKPLQVWFTPRK